MAHYYLDAAYRTLRDDGGTFRRDGWPVDVRTLHGYLVGGVVPSGIVARPTFDNGRTWLANRIQDFAAQHAAAFAIDPSLFVGTWVHEGNVYIDVVEFVGNRTAALELARERGELAIWDCRSGNEVNAEAE